MKLTVDAFLMDRVALIGSLLGLQRSYNSGIAFGIRLPGALQEVVIALALLLVCLLARKARTRPEHIGYGLIVGGAFANILDRLSDGVVTDFIQAGAFPIFNVADSCITVGVCLLLFQSFPLWKKGGK